ncbi:uncharacterized protein METZ01_LOCUS31918 [marine metagenome]|uniref:Uncharacterized protein n=1 Tax=marine metagenome TaxID=408172 RepID=A0A381QJI5_9ZZZZ
MTLDSNSERVAKTNRLIVGKTQLSCEFVDPGVLGQARSLCVG